MLKIFAGVVMFQIFTGAIFQIFTGVVMFQIMIIFSSALGMAQSYGSPRNLEKVIYLHENYYFLRASLLVNFRLNIHSGSHMTKVRQKSGDLTQAVPKVPKTLCVVYIQARRTLTNG